MAILVANQPESLRKAGQRTLDYLDSKSGGLNHELERLDGGVLDDRDAATELRDRLQRELNAKALAS